MGETRIRRFPMSHRLKGHFPLLAKRANLEGCVRLTTKNASPLAKPTVSTGPQFTCLFYHLFASMPIVPTPAHIQPSAVLSSSEKF